MLNAHCVEHSQGQLMKIPFEFIIGSTSEGTGKRFAINGSKTEVETHDPGNKPERDLAFMTLMKAVKPEEAVPLTIAGIDTINTTTSVYVTGFIHRPSKSYDNQPMTQSCKIMLNEPNAHAFLTNCSISSRMSSSPLYALVGKEPRVIGIAIGNDAKHDTDDENEVDYSTPFSAIFLDGSALRNGFDHYRLGIPLLDAY